VSKGDQTLLGLVPWKPQPGSAAGRCLSDVRSVLEEWVGSGIVPSLTTRAVLYRLLPLGWEKRDEDHPLGYVLERARRAGIIPFDRIADGRSDSYIPFSWASPSQFRDSWRGGAENYRLDRLSGQKNIELWIETAGMVAMLEGIADGLGTPLYSSSGMNTLASKYEAANRLIQNRDRGSVIVFVGDLDPWGEMRYANVREDVLQLAKDISGAEVPCEFLTAALTRGQVVEHAIPTEPCKPTIRGGTEIAPPGVWEVGDPTAQAEALPPDVLVNAIRSSVMEHVDEGVLAQTIEDEKDQRAHLLADVGHHGADA